jgi:hypothetical protein
MLKPLNLHCADLSQVLHSVGDRWWNASEWLQTAASVKNVEVDMLQYDLDFGYCSGADEYQMAREKLLTTFVTQLTIFSFVWGGLEAAIEEMGLPDHPQDRGKINSACNSITTAFRGRTPISPYLDELTEFRTMVARCRGYNSVNDRFISLPHLDYSSVGLYAVYKLRNLFAHGSLSFPVPDGENRPISGHGELLTHATRIVLLSLQMLFSAFFQNQGNTVPFAWSPDDEEQECELLPLLRVLHFHRSNDADQADLLTAPV